MSEQVTDAATTAAPADTAAPAAAPAVTDAPAPAAAPAIADWRSMLPAEVREAPALKKFQDPAALAKSYVEMETLIGRKGVIPPKPDDPAPVHEAYRQAMGIPDKPEGYEIKVEAPEGVWNAETSKTLATWAHELGLTPAQAQGIAERYAKLGGDGIQQQEAQRAQAREQATDLLRREWGAAFDAKLEHAKRAVREFGGDDLVNALQESGLGSHPAMIRAMAGIGERMGEDRPPGMGAKSGAMTPDQAKAERVKLMQAGSPYWDRKHPEHRLTVERVKSLTMMEIGQAA